MADPSPKHEDTTPVRIVDLDMPMPSLVWMLVKLALASVPAMVLLSIIFTALLAVCALLFGVSVAALDAAFQ